MVTISFELPEGVAQQAPGAGQNLGQSFQPAAALREDGRGVVWPARGRATPRLGGRWSGIGGAHW